jgi:hypothetical protein
MELCKNISNCSTYIKLYYGHCCMKIFVLFKFQGKFILTFNYGNHNYGLNRDTVEGIARDGLASCIHMEIEVSVLHSINFVCVLGSGYSEQPAHC